VAWGRPDAREQRMNTRLEGGIGEIIQALRALTDRALQCLPNASDQGISIARIDRDPEFPAAHGLKTAIENAGHHGHAASHGFQQHDAEPLAAAREHKGARGSIEFD
jgi:hypothetical protein